MKTSANFKRFSGLLFSAFVALLYLTAALPSAATVTLVPGDLVKLPDDGNLQTDADSAVYYYGTDGKRYVFPNSQTYFSWYKDFTGVKIISAAQMASLTIGGNVTYRPGTKLVKIVSDPNVYAVEPGGQLRWIQSEAIAKALYGDLWNKRVDDVPDAFFFNYKFGAPLSAAVYPDGSIVKRTGDGAYFLIDKHTKRKITSDAVREALRVQDGFVLTATGDLSDYPDAADLTAAESSQTDTSQKSGFQAPDQTTFSIQPPASPYFAVGGDAVLMELHVASPKQVTISHLSVDLKALTGTAPAEGQVDDDFGGMVYGNNAQPNFKMLRFVDAQGNEPFGRNNINVDITQDQEQSFSFAGSFSVPANTDTVLYLKAQTNSLLPTGEKYRVTLLASGTIVSDATGKVPVLPATDIFTPDLITLNATLEVSSSSLPGAVTYVRGATDAHLGGFVFKASTQAPNVINSITVQGYYDNENISGYLPGGDADNGSETRVKDLVSTVRLYDTDGHQVGNPTTVDVAGKATFSGLTFNIPAGQKATLIIKGDLSKTIELGSQPDKVAFDIEDAANDLAVVDDHGNHVNATGKRPNGGDHPINYATVKKNGTAKFSWSGNIQPVIVGREALLGTLSVAVTMDSYALKSFAFRQVGGVSPNLLSARLEYPDAAGKTVSLSQDFMGDTLTFVNLPAWLPKDQTTTIKLYGRLATRNSGASYGGTVNVRFASEGPLQFISQSDNTGFTEQNLSTDTSVDFQMGVNQASNITVRFSALTGATTTDSPTQAFRGVEVPVLGFSLKAEPEGPVRVAKLTFKLSPDDAGLALPANDALELWPALTRVGVLLQKQGTATTSRWGEGGSTGHLKYSTYHGDQAISYSGTWLSQAGDYGLLTIEFDTGSEMQIPAGATSTFQLALETDKISDDKDHSLKVELLGGPDFLWTDIPSGYYVAMQGQDASGLGLSATVPIVK